jgi:hypothetical protein
MSAIIERDHAVSILASNQMTISKIYKECYLSMGRGALLVYAQNVIDARLPRKLDYRTKKEMLAVFDAPHSQTSLATMIDSYNPRREGILTLITSHSNATFFVTVKF